MNKLVLKPQDRQTLDFAEKENLKCKNLFNPHNTHFFIHLLKSYKIEDNLIRVVRGANYNNTRIQYNALDMKDYLGKTLYFKAKCYASGNNTGSISVRYISYNGADIGDELIGQNFNGSAEINLKINIPTSVNGDNHYLGIMFYVDTSTGVENDYVEYTNIMLSTEDIDFLEYNGEIINEKKLSKKLSLKPNFYFVDGENYISIQDSSLTTLKEYFDLFNQDDSKTYGVNLGGSQTSNFQKLVGVPAGNDYFLCRIRKVIKTFTTGCYDMYEIIAHYVHGGDVAIGYISRRYTNNYSVEFSGWTMIGGWYGRIRINTRRTLSKEN